MKTIQLLIAGFVVIVVGSPLTAQDNLDAISRPVRITLKPKDVTPPSVSLVYDNNSELNAEGKVEVSIRVFDSGGLSDISINDEKIDAGKKDSLILKRQFAPGQEVNVVAHDVWNNTKERGLTIKGLVPAPVSNSANNISENTAPKHKYYGLFMAVNDYQDSEIAQLSEPIKDATLLKQVLIDKYTFNEEDITFLKNPTNEEMQIAFEDFSNKVTPNDFVVIFFAGHGYYDEKRGAGYWFPSDARKQNTAKWFRNSTLVEDIRAIPSKHTLLVSDACFSGAIFASRAPFNNASTDIYNNMKMRSRKAITSGSLTTVPDKSVFMKYLLQFLSDNENEYLSTEELFEKLRPIVRNNTDTDPRYGEIKQADDENGIFYFHRKK